MTFPKDITPDSFDKIFQDFLSDDKRKVNAFYNEKLHFCCIQDANCKDL